MEAKDGEEETAARAASCATGLSRKVGLVLGAPFVGAALAALLFLHLASQGASAPSQINLAGRQRMLAVQLGDWAEMVASGQDEDRPRLGELVAEYDLVLRTLESGGALEGRAVAPAPDELRPELAHLAALWQDQRPRLLLIADRPAGAPEIATARDEVKATVESMRVGADRLTAAMEARALRLQRQMVSVLVAAVCIHLGLLLFGVWYARRYIVEPVLRVGEGARRVARGDYAYRVTSTTHDEISALAFGFNVMAEQVHALLDAVDLRRKHAETLADSLPLGTALLDDDLVVLRVNRAFDELLGGRATRGRPVTDLVALDGLAQRLRAVMGGAEPLRGLRFELLTAAGVRPVRLTAVATSLGDQGPEAEARLLLVVEDLTEEERLRAEAHASAQSFRGLIEASPDAIAVQRDGRFVYVNPALVRALDVEPGSALVGSPVREVVHPEDWDAVAERARSVLVTGRPSLPAEVRFTRKDGTFVSAEVVVLRTIFSGQPAVVAVARDLTERKQLTARMMEMDRMIAVGTLAAGVGHEINNPLAYVVANLDYLAEELPRAIQGCRTHQRATGRGGCGAPPVSARLDELLEVLDEARHGAGRVRDIVRDLKVFSRADPERRAPLDLAPLIDSALSMAWNEIRHRARLVKAYGEVPVVEANEGRLAQVFLNLVVNAAQAIPEGAADANAVYVRTRSEGGWAIVEIEDTGPGIPGEDVERLFEPFFTTKPVGQGTGLGLAICRQIVNAHGGRISVESEPGRGAIFRVALPPAGPVTAGSQRTPVPAVRGRRGRILVVDDEPMVGRIIGRVLAAEHDVVVLGTAREALELLGAGAPFDLVFCDLMMPEMTGMDLHAALATSAPEVADRMIFLTGGAFTPRAREFLDAVPNLRVDKPFDVRNVRALLRDLLR